MATLFRSPAAQNGQKGSRVLLPHGLPPVNNLSEYTCKNDRVPVAQWLGHRTSNQRSCRLSGGRSGMAPLRPPPCQSRSSSSSRSGSATCLQCATSSEVAFAVSRLGSLTLFDQLEPLEANKGRSACPWHEPIPYRAVAVAVVSNSRSGIVAVVGLATLRPQKP